MTPITANGLATARAPTALMAVEILRRRRFGTEVSSIWTTRFGFFEPLRQSRNRLLRRARKLTKPMLILRLLRLE